MRALGIDEVAGGELLSLFPLLTLGITGVLFLLPLQRIFWVRLGQEPLIAPASGVWKVGLALSGWASFAASTSEALQDGRSRLVADIARSGYGWLGCVEGRGLIGLGVGLLVGLAFVIWGALADRTNRARSAG